jgi:hypothetical protein
MYEEVRKNDFKRTENPRVGGSIPSPATTLMGKIKYLQGAILLLFYLLSIYVRVV